jgi:aspartate ammonia-lyase
MRIEQDSLGTMELQDDDLFGINTLRAASNFELPGKITDLQLIHSLAIVKKAAALAYEQLGVREKGIYEAVASACDDVTAGKYDSSFFLSAFQGGAGTSTNMNVNEVVANAALKKLGHKPGEYSFIHPLDDVNRGQSTNDDCPTALRISAIIRLRHLSNECDLLETSLRERAAEFTEIRKLGRTELMDAVPITLGNEFTAYADAVHRDHGRMKVSEERLSKINLGGTAVGLGNNSTKEYRVLAVQKLNEITGLHLEEPEDLMDPTQNNDVFVEVSGLLKALAVNLLKIAGDIRLMSSGPNGGLNEIHLQPLQQGSSIMPGKINPVMPEMIMEVAMRVIANDEAITMAASRGEFELNAFFPLIADSLLESLDLLNAGVHLFNVKCIQTLTPNAEKCHRLLMSSSAFGTAYIGRLGYDRVSHIIKENTPEKAKEILDQLIVKINGRIHS